MNTKEKIIELITEEVKNNNSNGFFREPIVGFSSAKDELFKHLKQIVGEHHILPEDILPEAETVVSFFIPFSEALVESNKGKEVSREWAQSYVECNILINNVCTKLVEALTASGIKAGAVKATGGYDEKTLVAAWSHRSAAYIAGLGMFGQNRILITKKGGAGRYGSIVISEVIQPDARTGEEHCFFHQGKYCRYCMNKCPVGALAEEGFDRHKCNKQLMSAECDFPDLKSKCCGKCVVGPCAIIS